MNFPRKLALVAALIAGFGGVGILSYEFGIHHAAQAENAAAGATTGKPDVSASSRKILYWQDPMVPGQRFDKPGKSPYMDMPLVPVYADGATDSGGVRVSARQVQNLGIRNVEVTQGRLTPSVEVSGEVVWNERGLAVVQARTTAFVEKLYVRATLDPVAKGQPLVDLYVPDWVAAQEEFLAVRRMRGEGMATLVDGARARMRQAGMGEALIAEVERSGTVQARVTLRAPVGGRVVELSAREGMTVSAGSSLFRINSLDSVWVNAEVPESQAALVRTGMMVEAHAAGFPNEMFRGRIQAILPEVDATTRTLKARIELANPGARLAPGMFVRVGVGEIPRPALLLPTEALIRTGKRNVVMLAEDEGKYHPVEVRTGQEADGQVEILAGLQAGQKVVVSGQFLLDSESSLRAVGTRTKPAAVTPERYQTEAVFESLDENLAMLSHPAIPALKWGAMTMGFTIPKDGWPRSIKPGQKVHVSFRLNADGSAQLIEVMALGGAQK
jgi:membrane fusion protein, copper/silver efflux system